MHTIRLVLVILLLSANLGWAEDYRITFTDIPDTYIYFDRANNQWKYKGDLKKIGDEIFKQISNCELVSAMPGIIEIYRGLKNQEKSESMYD